MQFSDWYKLVAPAVDRAIQEIGLERFKQCSFFASNEKTKEIYPSSE